MYNVEFPGWVPPGVSSMRGPPGKSLVTDLPGGLGAVPWGLSPVLVHCQVSPGVSPERVTRGSSPVGPS